jgi:superfamily I DNA and/or RNA helicase
LDNLLTLASAEQRPSIAIISPYREQVQFIQDHIKKDFDHYPDDDITVDTIDSFQGSAMWSLLQWCAATPKVKSVF